jgi:hypothetical protein
VTLRRYFLLPLWGIRRRHRGLYEPLVSVCQLQCSQFLHGLVRVPSAVDRCWCMPWYLICTNVQLLVYPTGGSKLDSHCGYAHGQLTVRSQQLILPTVNWQPVILCHLCPLPACNLVTYIHWQPAFLFHLCPPTACNLMSPISTDSLQSYGTSDHWQLAIALLHSSQLPHLARQ